MLAIAAGIYWLIGRNLATIVTAAEAAATIAVLFVLCALADLVTGYPYQAVLFLLAAGALGFAFLLLQQGTIPVELRLGGVVAVASAGGLVHLRMLEELRDAGILSADEFAGEAAADRAVNGCIRHCEQSEAISCRWCLARRDCRVAPLLAMTKA